MTNPTQARCPECARLADEVARLRAGLENLGRQNGGNPTDAYSRGWAQGIEVMASAIRTLLVPPTDSRAGEPADTEGGNGE